MFRSFFKIALRNLLAHKAHSFINIAGLAAGLTCCLLILLYVQDELSFDRRHEKANRIYRLAVEYRMGDRIFLNSLSAAPLVPALLRDYPEIERAVRIYLPDSSVLVSAGDKRFYEERFYHADASVFEVFTFPFLKGDSRTALREPNTVVLTESMARKYFGPEDPVGKTVSLNLERDYLVIGVIEDVPANAHLHFDFLASFASLERVLRDSLNSWFYNPYFSYVLLPPGYSPRQVDNKIASLFESHVREQLRNLGWSMRPFLQPLTDIHLHPLGNEQEAQGDIRYVTVFSAIAGFILLIACINYMNLATARAEIRAREVGLRKVLGSSRRRLVAQFMGESVLTAFLAALLAMALVQVLLPAFNALANRKLETNYLHNLPLVCGLAGLTLFIGFVSGAYPAFFLAAIRPIQVLRGRSAVGWRGFFSRKILVVFQFTVSVILIISALVVSRQLEYMRAKKLGYDQEQVIVVPVKDSRLLERRETLKHALLGNPAISRVTFASRYPGIGTSGTVVERPDAAGIQPFEIKFLFTDYEFTETLGIELAAGRSLSSERDSETTRSLLLNETGSRALGWKTPEEAIGQTLRCFGDLTGTVVGVVKDFHFQPLHIGMQPLLMMLEPTGYEYALIRVSAGEMAGALDDIRRRWTEFAPQWPFDYLFLDENFGRLYQAEKRIGKIFGTFSLLAVLIACLGLFGLASFTAGRRTREIGIRKVLGATPPGIVSLLSREFVRLVLLANAIAWPIAYLAMEKWLRNFAYRTDIAWWVFGLAGALALLIAFLTVSAQAVKAALANPADSLRYE